MEVTGSVTCFPWQSVCGSEKSKLSRVVALKEDFFHLSDVQK